MEKNFALCAKSKINSNSCVVRIFFSEQNKKNHNPPPPPLQVKWSVPYILIQIMESSHIKMREK